MATVLGLDVGMRRVGVAIADTACPIPQPLCIVERGAQVAERRLLELIAERAASLLVVGLPLDEGGYEGAQCEDIRRFVRRLTRRTPIEVRFVDEYLSSRDAQELLQAGPSRSRRLEDDAAAALILQMYFKNPGASLPLQ